MSKRMGKPRHNYLKKILQMRSEGKLGKHPGVSHLFVEHDDWCGVFKGKRCNCDPYILEVADGDN